MGFRANKNGDKKKIKTRERKREWGTPPVAGALEHRTEKLSPGPLTRQQYFERESPWATKSAPRPDLARNHEDRAPSIREQKIQRTLARLLSRDLGAEQKD
jgi:hypothetical protein